MHFVQINITVRTGNLWLSNVAATLFHQSCKSSVCLNGVRKDTEWSQTGRSIKQIKAEPPQCYRHTLMQHLLRSPTQCVTVCVSERSVPWQCGQPGPFKSPWAAGESPKKMTPLVKMKEKQKQHSTKKSPISQTMSYVHLKTNFSFCFVFLHRSILSLEYKNRFLIFFCLFFFYFEKNRNQTTH